MSKIHKVGDLVTMIRHGEPVGVVRVTKVKMRLGKPVGYVTDDNRKWDGRGHEPGTWSASHIVAATQKHRDTIRRARISATLAHVERSVWQSMPLARLSEVWAIVKPYARKDGGA